MRKLSGYELRTEMCLDDTTDTGDMNRYLSLLSLRWMQYCTLNYGCIYPTYHAQWSFGLGDRNSIYDRDRIFFLSSTRPVSILELTHVHM